MKEEWKEIELYGRKYEVSNFGEIRSVYQKLKRVDGAEYEIKPKLLKQRLNSDGYCEVTVGFHKNRTTVRVHRIVAITFIPNPNNKKEVNHIDFNRTNNRVDNLEWTTHEENIKHSIIYNIEAFRKSSQGANNGRAVYTEEQVKMIREMYDNGTSIMNIVKKLYPTLDYKERKKKWSRVNEIAKRITWKCIA